MAGNLAARAFSLVEMVISLGIASFAMVSLVGLIPLGLKTSREAIDTTVQSQMVQMIRNQVLLDNFEKLQDHWDGRKLYFDDQGLQVEDESAPTRVFTADVDVQMAKAANSALPESDVRTIVVRIFNRAAPFNGSTYTLVLANTGTMASQSAR